MIIENNDIIRVGDTLIRTVWSGDTLIYPKYPSSYLNLLAGSHDYANQIVTVHINDDIKNTILSSRSTQTNIPFSVVWEDKSVFTNVISADKTDPNKYYFHMKGIGPRSNMNAQYGGWRDSFFFPFTLIDNTIVFSLQSTAYNGYDSSYDTSADPYCRTITFDCQAGDVIEILDRDFTLNHPIITVYTDLSPQVRIRQHTVPRIRWYRNGELILEGAREVDQFDETWTLSNTSYDPIHITINFSSLNAADIDSVVCNYFVKGGKTLPPSSGFTVSGTHQIKFDMMRRMFNNVVVTMKNGTVYTTQLGGDYGIDRLWDYTTNWNI